MQRLFSTFPNHWPGAGLLILRLAAGLPLLIGGKTDLRGLPPNLSFAVHLLAAGMGMSLIAGLCTPIVAALQSLQELWAISSGGNDSGTHLLLAAIDGSLAMLGPGAWSIDARLFGRKRISIGNR
jgi:putative oxidoreductase